MFGNTPTGIVILDLLLFIFGVVTVPLLYRIFTSLSSLLQGVGALTEKIGDLCETNKEIKEELVNARLRDKDLENSITNLDQKFENCKTEVNNKINNLKGE